MIEAQILRGAYVKRPRTRATVAEIDSAAAEMTGL